MTTNGTRTQYIWNPETGITDIEVPWSDLAATEVASIAKIWAEEQERLKGSKQLKEFTQRLSREWAIETGIIENLYQIDRGVTQTLIERGFHAEFLAHGTTDKPVSYVINLLRDQQDALEGVFDFITNRRALSVSYIKELHAALVRSQHTTEAVDPNGRLMEVTLIKGDWKKQPNYPTRDGVVYHYCPPEQVASEMERLVEMHAEHMDQGVAPEVEAAWLHHRFAQIHPFQDGNGRVARALASLVLIRAGLFPLVVTRDDKTKYLDALEAADKEELKPLVNLFAGLQRAQFRKATALSESIIAEGADVKSVMQNLLKVAEKSRAEREREHRKVFQHAKALESDTARYFEELVPDLKEVLGLAHPNGNAFVMRSTDETAYYYKGQIIENARKYLDYFADTNSYKAWVSLNMVWHRKGRLVFAFHGIGQPFTGSLVCAPFLEFRDSQDDEQAHTALAPVADEPFVFFYSEDDARVVDRFKPWREKVMTVALKELSKNL